VRQTFRIIVTDAVECAQGQKTAEKAKSCSDFSSLKLPGWYLKWSGGKRKGWAKVMRGYWLDLNPSGGLITEYSEDRLETENVMRGLGKPISQYVMRC
jgi:hypothetical protein